MRSGRIDESRELVPPESRAESEADTWNKNPFLIGILLHGAPHGYSLKGFRPKKVLNKECCAISGEMNPVHRRTILELTSTMFWDLQLTLQTLSWKVESPPEKH